MSAQPAAATLNRADPRFDLTVAFQPMLVTGSESPFGWRAVANAGGRSFAAVAASLAPEQRPALEARRITLALERAVALGINKQDALVAIPLGAAAGQAETLLTHLFRAAVTRGIAIERLVVEINADERGDLSHAVALAEACRARGLSVSLDRFAAGPVALKLLARFTPRFVQLDSALVRNIDTSTSRRLIAEGVMRLARNMGVTVIAGGVVRRGEHSTLAAMGVHHFHVETAGLREPDMPRREPRSAPTPTHRRLAHHQRSAFPLRTAAPTPVAFAL